MAKSNFCVTDITFFFEYIFPSSIVFVSLVHPGSIIFYCKAAPRVAVRATFHKCEVLIGRKSSTGQVTTATSEKAKPTFRTRILLQTIVT